jgi:hypothetical protein
MVLLHAGDIQRFHCDCLVLAYNSKREVVQEIVTLVGDLLVAPGKLLDCLLPVL